MNVLQCFEKWAIGTKWQISEEYKIESLNQSVVNSLYQIKT